MAALENFHLVLVATLLVKERDLRQEPIQAITGEISGLLKRGQYRDALDSCDRALAAGTTPVLLRGISTLKLDALAGLGRWTEMIDLGTTLISQPGVQRDLSLMGRIHGLVGFAYLRQGDQRQAEKHVRASIHIYTWDTPDQAAAVRQQRRLALLYLGSGLLRQSSFEMETAIEQADAGNLDSESGILRVNLAVALLKMGDLRKAATSLDSATAYLERADRQKWLVLAALVRANLLRISGHPAKALELLSKFLPIIRDEQYSREEAIALEYCGDCYLEQHRFGEALEHYQIAFGIAERTAPDGDVLPELCHRMGEAMVYLGDPNGAILICERGLRVARNSGDRYEECATYRVYAMAHRAAGNPSKALRLADEGVDLCRLYELPYELARVLAWAGEVRLQTSTPEEQMVGRKQLWEARGVFERMGLTQWTRSIDGQLGFDPLPESVSQPAIQGLEDLDRNALRFGIVTCNRQIGEAVEVLQSIGPSSIPVLITGESGVGKELLAQALHKMSPRRKGPFVAVNCGAISVNLLDSEFFGHERGAFTGAVASREGILASSDKGTLFLDEVGDLPLPVQAALLRVLETGEVRAVGRDDVRKVDIRIVAATNAVLEDLVGRGLFRQDLFYRLNGIRVSVPPLRDREEDIKALFRYFWSQMTTTAKKRLKVDESAEALLSAYGWPGNVRELRNEVARVVALSPEGSIVGPDAFLRQLKQKDVGVLRRERAKSEDIADEREQIVLALRAHRGNKAEAARSLGGMKRTTLLYKIERLGIRPDEYQVRE